MLWLGVCLPGLPLEVFAHPEGTCASLLAVCSRVAVLQANATARERGVHTGMKRAAALALSADLRLIERDPVLENQVLRQVACWALQFTPSVSLQPPAAQTAPGGALPDSGLLMEVEPSLRLFGGHEALVTLIGQGLAEQGLSVRIGSAPTATGAWLLARHRHGACALDEARLNARLADLPVTLLEQALPHLDSLASVGVRTVKELIRLPRAGLARRFSSDLLIELDRAFGHRPDPRPWFEAPASFHARLELLAQVNDAQALLFAARRLVVQLAGWLAARHAAVPGLDLLIEHDGIEPTVLALRMAEPSRDPERITTLLREKLAVTRLQAPAHTLRIDCDTVVALADTSASLFPMPQNARDGFGRLVERLQARLGREHVQRVLLARDHRPEAAWRFQPVDLAHAATSGASGASGALRASQASRVRGPSPSRTPEPPAAPTLPRPLWLRSRPIPIAERNNRPYWHGPLSLLAGPERIESGWWDDALVRRDYFIATDDAHALLWIYRERLPDADSGQGWFIHGHFG